MAKEHNSISNTKAALNTLPLIIMLIWQSGSYMPQTHAITGEEKLGSSMTLSEGNNGRFATDQKIATAGNNVYVTWSDNTLEAGNSISNSSSTSTSKGFDIFFRKSIDNGDSFGDVVNLSNNEDDNNETSNYIDSLNPRLAVTPRSTTATNNDNNTDATATTTNTTANNNSSSNNNNDNLYVVWTGCNTMSDEPECDIFFTKVP